MTVEQLHDELQRRGQKVSGNKQELIDRLKQSDNSSHSSDGRITDDYNDMTVEQLQNELQRRGQKVSGNKQELIDRLEESDRSCTSAVGKRSSPEGKHIPTGDTPARKETRGN